MLSLTPTHGLSAERCGNGNDEIFKKFFQELARQSSTNNVLKFYQSGAHFSGDAQYISLPLKLKEPNISVKAPAKIIQRNKDGTLTIEVLLENKKKQMIIEEKDLQGATFNSFVKYIFDPTPEHLAFREALQKKNFSGQAQYIAFEHKYPSGYLQNTPVLARVLEVTDNGDVWVEFFSKGRKTKKKLSESELISARISPDSERLFREHYKKTQAPTPEKETISKPAASSRPHSSSDLPPETQQWLQKTERIKSLYDLSADPETNPYQVFKLSPTAKFNEVKRAYRRAVQLFHPDKRPPHLHPKTQEIADAVMRKLNKAMEKIEKEKKKQK